MTYTYDLSAGTDLDLVRFYTSDTDGEAVIHSDEELNGLIAHSGTWQKATEAALQSIIRKLARAGKVKQDWLEVDNATGMANFRAMLAEFREQFAADLGKDLSLDAEAIHVWRADSDATGVSYDDQEDA